MEMSERKENLRYDLLIACQVMMMCAGFNYVTYYLLSVQVSNREIGILVAASCLVAIFVQTMMGRLIDKNVMDVKKLLLCLALIQVLCGVLILVIHMAGFKVVFFGVFLCITLVIQPILNSFGFFYQSQGITVNYGIARGIGSLCYSGCSMLLGFLTVRLGSSVVPASCSIIAAVVFLLLLSGPSLRGVGGDPSVEKEKKEIPSLTKCPMFLLMLVGLTLVMVFHNMVMTFFINVIERAGGNSENMGVAVGIAGLVEIPILFFYTRIKKDRPSRYFLAASGVAFLTKAVLFLFAREIWIIYAIQCLQCLAYGLMAASRVYYVDEVFGKENEASGQARMSATESIGIVVGSALGGFLMQSGGVEAILNAGAVICFIGVVCMVLSAWKQKDLDF